MADIQKNQPSAQSSNSSSSQSSFKGFTQESSNAENQTDLAGSDSESPRFTDLFESVKGASSEENQAQTLAKSVSSSSVSNDKGKSKAQATTDSLKAKEILANQAKQMFTDEKEKFQRYSQDLSTAQT